MEAEPEPAIEADVYETCNSEEETEFHDVISSNLPNTSDAATLYGSMRKNGEEMADLKMDDFKRQHETECAKLKAKIEALEEQLKQNTRLLSVSSLRHMAPQRALTMECRLKKTQGKVRHVH